MVAVTIKILRDFVKEKKEIRRCAHSTELLVEQDALNCLAFVFIGFVGIFQFNLLNQLSDEVLVKLPIEL